MDATLLVLAAGMGSRYGGLKQMDPVGPGGETLMDYGIFDAMRAGFNRVVFIIREDFAEAFKRDIASRYEGRIDVGFAYQDMADLPAGFTVPAERGKPWGTAHAVRAARGVVDTPFAVINADDFYGRDAYRQMYQFFSDGAAANGNSVEAHFAMVGYTLAATLSPHGTVARGICRTDTGGMLVDVTEMTQLIGVGDGVENRPADGSVVRLQGSEPCSMNFWGFTPQLFDFLEELFPLWLKSHVTSSKDEWYIPFVVDSLVTAGRADVRMLRTEAAWLGLTYRAERESVATRLRQFVDIGEYPLPLW